MEVAREYIAILEESKFEETFDMTVPLELVATQRQELAGVA
jgi:ribose 5-phosphate isomerase